MTENNKYFAYCRESVDLQTGIEIQKDKINKFCNATGKEVFKWFIDNDASAYKIRPNYEKMMKAISETQECKGIVCTSLSRFGRNTSDVLIAHKNLKEQGKELILIDSNIDSNSISGKAMLGMLAVFADFERDTIRDRLESGIKWANIHGTKSGKPTHRPQRVIDWKAFDKYRELGLSIPAIAKLMSISKVALYKKVKERKT